MVCHDEQVATLNDGRHPLKERMTALLAKTPMFDADKAEYETCLQKQRDIDKKIIDLKAAYEKEINDAIRLESLLTELAAISTRMSDEAKKLVSVTKVVSTVGALLTLGQSAIDAIDRV